MTTTEALTGKITLTEEPTLYLQLINECGDVIASTREVAKHVRTSDEMWQGQAITKEGERT